MEKKIRKEVEFLDYIGSRKESFKFPSSPADSAYIADQGMTGTLAESIKPVAEEISRILDYITGFFQWDTESTVDNDTLIQYRKRPDYLKYKKQFNALLSGWSLNTDDTVGLKPVDLKSFDDQELKDLALDLDNFIKSADIPMIISDTLKEDMTTAAIAVPEGGTGLLVKQKQSSGYVPLSENDYNKAEIEYQDKQNFDQSELDRVFLAQLLSSYKGKFPSSLQTKLENLFATQNITNINNLNLDIFSDAFVKTMRGKVEELISKAGLSVDMFESKEVKTKKIIESYGLIEKETEEEEKREEKIYAFKSKNRVIIVKGFDEDQARDAAVKIMAPNDRLPELPEGQYELSYILPGEEELTEAAEDSLKRYIVSFDVYMFAKDDDAIKKAAAAFARKLDLEYDNKASVLEIYESPFGSTSGRKV